MKRLEMTGIDKFFGTVQVLKSVSLTVNEGEVHALLGENGAGKSTLMNVLTGIHPWDGGTIWFDGKSYDTMTIQQSEGLGIAFVHQELNLFNDLKVFENLFLTREYTTKFGALDKKRMRKETADLFEQLGVNISADAMVSDLKTSEKQLLEIAKALHRKAKLIILDEPTTSLNNAEIDHLFGILNHLKAEHGTSFIFISHKMPEIFALADRYTVFRNGEYITDGDIVDTTPEQITELMVGHSAGIGNLYQQREIGETVLKLEGFSGEGFHDVDLEVKKGQIIGLTGLQGSGSSELMQGVFGTIPVHAGTVEAFGNVVPGNSIHKAMRFKIAMLANNRKENSVVADMSLLENMYLAEHTLSAAKFHINKQEEQGKFDRYKQLLNIKAQSSADGITSLSGGNQQKVFLARWLNTRAEILLLDNPTQGIDVGAKEEIYALILELAKGGKTILINTLELSEIKKVADYCAVFYEGTIVKMLRHDEIEEKTVMLYSTGSGTREEEAV